MDADDTHDPAMIRKMHERIDQGADVVICSRFVAGGDDSTAPPFRRLLSRGAAVTFERMLGLDGVHDFTSGFRAYRVSLLARAAKHWGERLVEERGFACMVELLLKLRHANPVIAEVPLVLQYDRKLSAQQAQAAPHHRPVREAAGPGPARAGPVQGAVTPTRWPQDPRPDDRLHDRGTSMTTAIVLGGGISGLAAAHRLGRAGVRVTLLEASPQLGGLGTFFAREGRSVERFYHCVMPTRRAPAAAAGRARPRASPSGGSPPRWAWWSRASGTRSTPRSTWSGSRR